ncbi:hypothetical protein LguiA_016814 [Lonicera macranthoides]
MSRFSTVLLSTLNAKGNLFQSTEGVVRLMQEGLKNLENNKGKLDGPAVARKALTDISNVGGNFPKNGVQAGSKTMSSLTQGTRTAAALSSKPMMGKLRPKLSQVTGDNLTLKRVPTKDVKISSDELRTKVQDRISFNTVDMTSGRNLLPSTRKSLPVLKRLNELGSRDVKKENADNLGKGKMRYGIPVKPKVARKVVTQVSNAQSHLWRNRVSDGFKVMASRDEARVDAQALSTKLVKPIVKARGTVSNTQKTSKSMGTSVLKESSSGAIISLKRNEEMVTASLAECSASFVPHERTAEVLLSFDNNINLGKTKSDVIARRKSARRKSYTSLLMARSKLLKEHGEVTKQEFQPSIYDDCNHLEVAEYVDDIYLYYWVMEAQNKSLKNYMEIQTEINPQMRGILINWLIEVHLKFDLMQETLYLMVTLLDQYLSLVSIKKNEMQLVGLTALLMASKYEDFWHPRVLDLISISAESYTRDQMLGMEKSILRKLKFRLNAPTPYVFMLRFLKAAQSDTKLEHLAFYLIELCLVEYEALNFKPSLLCASAIYVARCTLQMTPPWTPLLGKHTHYEESSVRDCAEMILRFHKAARMGMLKVTYDKFMEDDHSRVSAIRPLDRLPH